MSKKKLEKRHCMSALDHHKPETEDALSYLSGRSSENYLSYKGIARQMYICYWQSQSNFNGSKQQMFVS